MPDSILTSQYPVMVTSCDSLNSTNLQNSINTTPTPDPAATQTAYTNLTIFLQKTLDQSLYIGKLWQSDTNKPSDWLQIPALASEWNPSPIPTPNKTNSCTYIKGYKITIHYSFALFDEKRMYYIIKIEKSPVAAEVSIGATSVQFGIYIDQVFHPPSVKNPNAFTEKYGSGLIGAVNYFFTEVILPIVQPSSVQVS